RDGRAAHIDGRKQVRRWRTTVLASMRFETFAKTRMRVSAVTIEKIGRNWRPPIAPPATVAEYGRTATIRFFSLPVGGACSLADSVANSAWAPDIGVPCANRPIMKTSNGAGGRRSITRLRTRKYLYANMGTHTSSGLPNIGPWNLGGATPIIVAG